MGARNNSPKDLVINSLQNISICGEDKGVCDIDNNNYVIRSTDQYTKNSRFEDSTKGEN